MKTRLLLAVAGLGIVAAIVVRAGVSDSAPPATITPRTAADPARSDDPHKTPSDAASAPLDTSPATDIPATGTRGSIAGTWLLKVSFEKDFWSSPSVLQIAMNADGSLGGTIDDLTFVADARPLHTIKAGAQPGSFETEDWRYDGTLSASGDEITGIQKPRAFLQKTFMKAFGQSTAAPFVMRRIDPLALPPRPESHFNVVDGHRVHYAEMARSNKARILFIHGSPGEWSNWDAYLSNTDLQKRATMIAVDRPGFGESDPGRVVPDLREQAKLLEPLLHSPVESSQADSTSTEVSTSGISSTHVPTLVVGWSEGGPIAAELAMDYPDEIDGAILIAPAIDPAHDGAQWYNHAATYWPVAKLATWVMGPEIMWCNQEMMPLEAQLEIMEPRWSSLKVPTVVIQGAQDGLVDPRTADFAERVMPKGNRVLRLPDAGHVSGWGKAALDTINDMLDRAERTSGKDGTSAGE